MLRAMFGITLINPCAAISQTASAAPMAARWKLGQSWHVEYVRSVPPVRAEPSPPRSPSERSVWKYEVAAVQPRQTRLRVEQEGGPGKIDLWFASGLTFRRAVRILDGRDIDLIVHPGQNPYFGWSSVDPLIFDWPILPYSKDSSSRSFTDDDGQRVAENIHFSSASQFEIVMTVVRTIDSGYKEIRQSRQTWTVGNPWWSVASIRTESVIDGKKLDTINLQGRTIP
jgi:hypothetical protein